MASYQNLKDRLIAGLEALEDSFTSDMAANAPSNDAEEKAFEQVLRDIRDILTAYHGSSIRTALTAIAPVALLTSGARTADTDTAVQTNTVGKALVLVVDITAGTGTIDALILKGKDDGGNVYTVATATPASAIGGAAGRHVFVITPNPVDFSTPLKFAAGAAGALPYSWYVTVDHTDATSVTYTLDGYVIP